MTTHSKAYEQGSQDGYKAVVELEQEMTLNPPDDRGDIRETVEGWFAAGQLGADEGLINAIGLDKAQGYLGVRGASEEEISAACEDYNAGYKAGALARVNYKVS